MDRKTIKFKTPVDEHEVEIYEYLTGGESEQIQDAISNEVNVEIGGDVGGHISGKSIRKAQDKTFELMLVSIEGEKEDLVKKVKNFRQEDYDYVRKQIDEVTKSDVPETKKKKEKK